MSAASPMVVLAALAAAVPAVPASAADAVEGRLLVGLRDTAEPRRAAADVAEAGGSVQRRLGRIGAVVVRPRDGVTVARLRDRLRRLRAVRYVEPDYLIELADAPNDPLYTLQYSLRPGTGGISAPGAWDRRTNCSLVATLDGGLQYDHPDLKPNVWHNKKETKANGRDDDRNGWVDDYYGVDVVDGKGSGGDEEGHGTHVAGIVAGRGNNASGVTGVCWSGNVMSIRFTDARGRGSTSDAVAGIDYAIRHGAKIVNCSFGSSSKSSALQDAVDPVPALAGKTVTGGRLNLERALAP